MNKKCTTELCLPCVNEKKEILEKKLPNYKVDGRVQCDLERFNELQKGRYINYASIKVI